MPHRIRTAALIAVIALAAYAAGCGSDDSGSSSSTSSSTSSTASAATASTSASTPSATDTTTTDSGGGASTTSGASPSVEDVLNGIHSVLINQGLDAKVAQCVEDELRKSLTADDVKGAAGGSPSSAFRSKITAAAQACDTSGGQ
jgi:ABC-type transport system substrate-binding protein